MNTTAKRPRVRRGTKGHKKTVCNKPNKDRHVQREADKRNKFPKRPNVETHPFETTYDF